MSIKYQPCFLLWLLLLILPAYCFAATPVINVVGTDDISLKNNILAKLSFAKESCKASPQRLGYLLNQTDKQITQAARAVGYYELEYAIELSTDADCWQLQIQVHPGKAVTLNTINIELVGAGEQDTILLDTIKNLPLKPGDILHHGKYTKAKEQLLRVADNYGYFASKLVIAELKVYPEKQQAEIHWQLETGPRYHFGAIQWQETVFNPSLLKRFQTFASGEPFERRKLLELHSVLSSSGYFERVTVRVQQEQAYQDNGINYVPIQINLEPNQAYYFTVGAGAATDTGIRFKFKVDNRYINQYGHYFNYDLLLSTVQQQTRFTYSIPLRNPTNERLDFYADFDQEQNRNVVETKTLTFGTGYNTMTKPNWLHRYTLNWQYEDYKLDGEPTSATFLIPGTSWQRVSSNDPIYPTYGWRWQFSVRGGLNEVISDTSFLQLQIRNKWIFPLGFGRLLTRWEVGATAVDNLRELPPSLRFFAGGDNSVRGFSYQALSPTDSTGENIGGKNLVTASLEYDYLVKPKWLIAVFYDVGNATNEMPPDVLEHSVGLGARWISPIGPIRLDFAKPLDSDRSIRLHLSMGPDL